MYYSFDGSDDPTCGITSPIVYIFCAYLPHWLVHGSFLVRLLSIASCDIHILRRMGIMDICMWWWIVVIILARS